MLSQQLEGRFLFWSTLPRGHVANNIHCIQTKRCKHSSILFHSEAYCSQTMLYFLCLFLYVTFTPDVENKEKRERLTRRKGERCKCVGRRTTGLLKKKCIKSKITDNEWGSSKQHALYSVPVIQVQMPEYIHDVAWFTTTRSDCTISIITTKAEHKHHGNSHGVFVLVWWPGQWTVDVARLQGLHSLAAG
jgi:hypothetical protein